MNERWGDGHRSFHASATSFIDHLGRDEWDQAATFAIVCHPLARMVSNFFFLIAQCQRRWHSYCSDRLIPFDVDVESMADEEKSDKSNCLILMYWSSTRCTHPKVRRTTFLDLVDMEIKPLIPLMLLRQAGSR